ncbi:hypothetical protein COT08_00055 [Candidatus Woesebacteria bacterium CG07_land_8_20_14_0_80_44_9]|uniref:50S ribosomal protein L29 n=3 Tax=Candidatus Woeseibacteriota TaxID=1752722 RepID=A0A2H0BHS0_9BACT|nr:MAG: hypothetical protein COX04_00730 [Candidatus Woesebacteria bacterium CG22_combo_CG10-13_8_21_14_all_45_10]PIU28911.1 MAG: hypothetical protein COT08_00055 [Candidatus Woesebacteria bacterium CG07_land_8_20_14_0_80_44_9]PIZ46363.1 MAG: hypothetical protein COY30_00365 [Candidatus Woesebacteria bacterium CG_4_10_14_0_2_um_filter_44_9]
MKRNELTALRTKKVEELQEEVGQKKAQLNKKGSRKLRREIAQILTLIREKEIIESEVKVK